MGDSTGTLISPLQEKALGESFFRSIRAQLDISYDPDIQDYIQSLGQTLVANSDNPRQAFYFFVVLSDDINAFAGPGGVIGINSGLILNSESESELASVIAHEIAHVTQRHIYRAYESGTCR
jgi:predicted Zn-dependent protease